MAKFYRLNADMNGTDSIQNYIDSGQIIDLVCDSAETLDKHRLFLQSTVEKGDFVMMDTISTMLDTIRESRALGTNPAEPLWDPKKIDKYFGDKEYLSSYKMAGGVAMRVLHNLAERGAHVICLAHESEVKDPMAQMKIIGPDVNPAMVDTLIGASSDVFRLQALTQPMYAADGTIAYDVDTRILWLRRQASFTAKFGVKREIADKLPKGLPNPTMIDLFRLLDKVPKFMTIYGHPGAGKTSLGASAADFIASRAA